MSPQPESMPSAAMSSLPAELGFRMPAEWEPHEATWIAWPHHREDWPGKFAAISWVYTEIVRNLSRHERVELIVCSMNGKSGMSVIACGC